ncbi:orotidine 5'-phosphate decarboxylase [Oceanobacillus oncorhynchi subsp. incaldanensis]|uniref:Orotidine 5'-phosphate decarboxylase n=1 Tax=Oceanobacillus oncorhynchi TaxID=545501 RepID=A0A0A1MYE3_9BACI|nr:orotidine-5'-phosphate decarboxylase [Oceanobacillus oncorhynchi]UUI38668.1 orotidine-5'-phosphate decarboxylase [Oceanobacillus oncorhynchi]GIO18316.1 orotidine 5'-phosphate decarboxylase [Oceanobacillus oncorhynchi subsp. incaldanensis]CEI84362.1 Orotidine 5'-phosphate decarboxylase [Oceanobacillus oncorhynchi]
MSVFVALDFPTWTETERFLKDNDLAGVPVKVGMELFYREGPAIIEKLKADNHPIFLDLKLHDIPNTVHQAMKNIASLNVDMVTTHAIGGKEMIYQAKQGLAGSSTKLMAVTILTSMDDNVLERELGLSGDVEENVIRFAALAKEAGADGVVSSVHEVPVIKKHCGDDFLSITPGIRLADSSQDDQKRIATPEKAKELGSDFLVVGRSITKAENPRKAYEQVMKEWQHGE